MSVTARRGQAASSCRARAAIVAFARATTNDVMALGEQASVEGHASQRGAQGMV